MAKSDPLLGKLPATSGLSAGMWMKTANHPRLLNAHASIF